MRFFLFFLFIAVSLIFVFQNMQKSTFDFEGIAIADKEVVNYPYAVKLKKLYVVEGECVKSGDTIAVFQSVSLEQKITELLDEIYRLRTSKNKKLSNIKISNKKSELNSELISIRKKIENLKKDRQNTVLIAEQMDNIKISDTGIKKINAKIKSLEEKEQYIKRIYYSKIRDLNNEKKDNKNSITKKEKINLIKLKNLKKDSLELIKIAKKDWLISKVNYSENQEIKSFDPVLELISNKPDLVVGYLKEQSVGVVKNGDSLFLKSMYSKNSIAKGVVINVGSRIEELPERFRRIPDFPLWGQKVVISVKNNKFLANERLYISRGN